METRIQCIKNKPGTQAQFQVLPLAADLEKQLAFIGSKHIEDPAKIGFLAMCWQCLPSPYDYRKSKSFNRRVLAQNAQQFRFIAKLAGIHISRQANVGTTFNALSNYRSRYSVYARALDMFLEYSKRGQV